MKNLPNSTPKKQIIQWRNGQKTWIDTCPKKTSRWPNETWKNAQHHSSSREHKSKPQWDATSHLWLTLATQATIDVGKDGERRISFALLVGMQAGAATLENSMEVPQKIKNRTTLRPSNCTARYLSKGYRCAVLKGHMHPNVYSSTINNSQIMDRVQMPINWWMDKEGVVYMYNGILLGNQKEWNLPICNNVDGTRVYYAERNKSEKERYHMISFICGI